jgi:hypothetical protein
MLYTSCTWGDDPWPDPEGAAGGDGPCAELECRHPERRGVTRPTWLANQDSGVVSDKAVFTSESNPRRVSPGGIPFTGTLSLINDYGIPNLKKTVHKSKFFSLYCLSLLCSFGKWVFNGNETPKRKKRDLGKSFVKWLGFLVTKVFYQSFNITFKTSGPALRNPAR